MKIYSHFSPAHKVRRSGKFLRSSGKQIAHLLLTFLLIINELSKKWEKEKKCAKCAVSFLKLHSPENYDHPALRHSDFTKLTVRVAAPSESRSEYIPGAKVLTSILKVPVVTGALYTSRPRTSVTTARW